MKEIDILFKICAVGFFIMFTATNMATYYQNKEKDDSIVIYVENIEAGWVSSQLMEDGKTLSEYKKALNGAMDAGEITGYQIYKGGKMYYSNQQTQ